MSPDIQLWQMDEVMALINCAKSSCGAPKLCGSLSVREVGGLSANKCQSVKCQSKTDQLTQSAKMALVIPDKFQHILRVMNTIIHGRKNYYSGI